MDAILVSVDYSDILSISLPINRRHFDRVTIVTSVADYPNVEPIAIANHCSVHATNAFYTGGATFAKWAALEEGLTISGRGRGGWLAILDADILWPRTLPITWQTELVPGNLYTPLRHMMTDIKGLTPETVPHETEWCWYPIHRNVQEWAGYSQVFHTQDPVLDPPPWYETNWLHAGGADSYFQMKWPSERKIRPRWNVLHLGSAGTNWMGRASPYIDGSVPVDSQQKIEQLMNMIRSRRGKSDRHSHEKL